MKTFTTSLSVDDAIEKLKSGVEAQNMRVVAHINGQANAAKIGKTVPGDQILEIFRPDFAIRVWEACKPAGHDIPLRIHVYEDAGVTNVACRMPTEVFEPFASPELMAVGSELDDIFNSILETVSES
ncbi:MAG: DUF302 domain-containing protein [Acidiferrobacterales bacterium]